VDSFDCQEVIGGPSVVTPHICRDTARFSPHLFIAAISGVYLGLVSVQAVGDLHLYVSYALSYEDAASFKRTRAWMMLPRIA